MKLFTIALGLSLALSPLFSWSSGSRVGNGTGGTKPQQMIRLEKLGIETSLPETFKAVDLKNGKVELEGLPQIIFKDGSAQVTSPKIQIMDLNKTHPELPKLSKQELANWFTSKNWKKLSNENPKCPEVQVSRTSNLVTMIVKWESHPGVTLVVDNTPETLKASYYVIKNLKPTNEKGSDCAWK